MKTVQIQFNPWDKIYNFNPKEIELETGDKVVVKTQLGMEIGRVVGFEEIKGERKTREEIKSIIRKANPDDLTKVRDNEKHKKEALDYCERQITNYNLSMKLVDVHFSFDGGRITFAFIADGRVDFREMVKDLTHHFQKSIRLQQLGTRDEARVLGDVGPCGRLLCCREFLNNLGGVTSELAETQQVAHRGPERLSGICGRLRCCLAYEQKTYETLAKGLPPIGSEFKTSRGVGRVIGWHTLKRTVDVELDKETIIEVEIK